MYILFSNRLQQNTTKNTAMDSGVDMLHANGANSTCR